jgi:hypothetical protein
MQAQQKAQRREGQEGLRLAPATQEEFLDLLASVYCTSTLPIWLVENPAFAALIQRLQPDLQLPSRYKWRLDLVNRTQACSDFLVCFLKDKDVSVTFDLWSRPASLESYMGMTLKAFNGNEQVEINAGLKVAPPPHDAVCVGGLLQEFLTEWKLEDSQVWSI